jgi:hypothetical protein
MGTYKCCKCGALNEAPGASVAECHNDQLAAPEKETESRFRPFFGEDQVEFAKIYENDEGKWD